MTRFWNGLSAQPEASATWRDADISPFEKTRVLDPRPDTEWLQCALQNVARVFPELSALRIAHAWAGAIDTTPDLVPVISKVDAKPGLVIASGFSGHGFGLGPGAGMLVSRLVMDDAPQFDIAPFRLARFSDGTTRSSPQMMSAVRCRRPRGSNAAWRSSRASASRRTRRGAKFPVPSR
jgi:glycine/D-amino acid oxidase-like deaminating enzyme